MENDGEVCVMMYNTLLKWKKLIYYLIVNDENFSNHIYIF